MPANADVLAAYLALWTDTTPARDLRALDRLTIAEVRFRDPIQEVSGRAQLARIFAESGNSVADSRVNVESIAWSDDRRAFIKWTYSGRIKRLGLDNWSVTGMSDIRLSEAGQIVSHEDFWDLSGGLFEHFPFVGWLFRRLRLRLRLEERATG